MKVAGGARERERGNFFLGIVCLVWSLTNSSCSPSSFRKYKHEYCTHYRSARTNLKENTPAQRLIPKETEKYTRGKKKCINIKTNTQMQRKIYKKQRQMPRQLSWNEYPKRPTTNQGISSSPLSSSKNLLFFLSSWIFTRIGFAGHKNTGDTLFW